MKFDLARIIKKVEGLQALSAPFTHEEIGKVIKEMPAGRATVPDGFSGSFIKSCWQIIKDDLCEVFDKLYSLNGQAFQRLNEAFITLLPKRPDSSSLFDYRPISLIHLVANLIAKVLSLRLAPRLGDLVSSN